MDVTELMIGQSKRASGVGFAGSMGLVSPPETVIAHIVALRAEAEPAAPSPVAASPRATSPHPVGKKEEEGAAEEKGKKGEEKGKKK